MEEKENNQLRYSKEELAELRHQTLRKLPSFIMMGVGLFAFFGGLMYAVGNNRIVGLGIMSAGALIFGVGNLITSEYGKGQRFGLGFGGIAIAIIVLVINLWLGEDDEKALDFGIHFIGWLFQTLGWGMIMSFIIPTIMRLTTYKWKVPAVIINQWESTMDTDGASRYVYRHEYEYQINGVTYTGTDTFGAHCYQVGTQVKVFVNRKHPEKMLPPWSFNNIATFAFVGFVCIVVSIPAILY